MTGQSSDQLKRMAAAAGARTEPGARPAGRTAVRTAPIRITVDLSPPDYQRLSDLAADIGRQAGIPRLALAKFIRALIETAGSDPAVTEAVSRTIRRAQ